MFFKLLKKSISLALAFSVILSLSCCREGDEILPEETTSALATETTPEMTPENIAKALQVTPEELDIMAKLNSYEIETWKSMPDIVTIRILSFFEPKRLQTEVVYIDKLGNVKKIIGSYTTPSEYDSKLDWATDQISQNKDAELIDVADIHTLIEFYNTMSFIDSNSKMHQKYDVVLDHNIFKKNYYFELYGIRNVYENDFETLLIARGDSKNPDVRNDPNGSNSLDLYLKFEPFIVLP